MLSDWMIRLRSLFRRETVDGELDEELRFHLEKQAAKYVQAGSTPEDALRRAKLEFGGLDQVKGDCREARGVTLVETLVQDVRFGMRVLRKSPGFTAVVVLTLGLGIGANTAIFTLVNAVMLQTLPVSAPEQLMVMQWKAHNWPHNVGTSSFGDCAHLQDHHGGENSGCSLTYPMFKEIRDRKDLFSGTMAFAGPSQLDLSGNGPASMARGELVSGDYFETLGVRPAIGRTLEPGDEQPGAAQVVVLDYAYWQRAFGGAADIVGRTIRLNNLVFTIVGVADRGFTRFTPGKSVDLWVSLIQAKPLGIPWAREMDDASWWLAVVARLRPGVSMTQAQAAVNVMFVRHVLQGAKPAFDKKDDPQLTVVPAQKGLVGIRNQFGEPLALLMAVVGIVLLIACANVAGLMLARGTSREKEMAIRLAMGAARRRVIRQLLTESMLLSFVGAAVGALLAYAGATGLAAFFAQNAYFPLNIDLHPNAPVLMFAMGAAVLTGIGFGLAPALRGARANVTTELKGNAASITPAKRGSGRFGLGSGLVVLQVALSMVVLTGAGLLLRTLDKLRNVDPGFDTRNILLFSIEPTLAGYKDKETQTLYDNLQRRLAAMPGVTGVSYSSDALLDGGLWTSSVRVEGQTNKDSVETQMLSVGPDFFSTMKIPLDEGRTLETTDMSGTPLAAVVNRAFVQRFVGSKNPIGLHFGGDDANDPKWQIVGVVADTKYDQLRTQDAATAYVPLTKGGATFALRTALAPAELMPGVRNVVNAVDSNLPVIRMRTQSQTIDRLLFNERLMTRLFGLFGVLGMVLACIGLYGLLSYEVARRTQEIGIRTALGARRGDVMLLVLRQGLLLVLCGIVVGTGAAIAATRLLESLLFNVKPTDPATFAAVAFALMAVGVAACCLPVRRALRVDPMVALRCQ